MMVARAGQGSKTQPPFGDNKRLDPNTKALDSKKPQALSLRQATGASQLAQWMIEPFGGMILNSWKSRRSGESQTEVGARTL